MTTTPTPKPAFAVVWPANTFWPPDITVLLRAYAIMQPYMTPDYPERDMSPINDALELDRLITMMSLNHPALAALGLTLDPDAPWPEPNRVS